MRIKVRAAIFTIILLAAPVLFTGNYDKEFEWSKNLDIYQSLLRELELFYVDETEPGKLVRTGIDQMLKTLDPYTVYVPESQLEDIELMTTGEYGGVGALVGQDGKKIYITDPYEGSPAAKAGLRAGDIILKVDDRPVEGKKLAEISQIMKGEIGSEIKFTIERPYTSKQITVNLVRERIRFPNVPFYRKLPGGAGYIRITGFTEGAGREVRDAFLDLKKQEITQVILDLRNNPGGLLIEAVDMVNIFVPRGQEIVSTRGKARQWEAKYSCRYEVIDSLIPLAVLVNSSSASASEIVAGAIQDLDRGVIIGQRTFGKGLVQTTRDLSYNAKLKLTTAKYYIPSGRCIQALDYSNRRPDGSVGNIPDSLSSEFVTKAGRKVRDGGGIVPDIQFEPRILSGMATTLFYKNKLFGYATKFRNQNESIPDPEAFEISDEVYSDFSAFLNEEKFTYQTASEDALDKLVKSIKTEKYYDQSKELIDQLGKIVTHDLDKDLELFKPEVKALLAEEIVGRYYFQRGKVQNMIKTDRGIKEAVSIFENPLEYKRILGQK